MITFSNSRETLEYLQQKYGSANYASWQTLRRQFYSYTTYTLAGASQFVFFGSAYGASGVTKQDTNLAKAGSFGQVHYLIKSLQMKLFVTDWGLRSWNGNDVSTIMADLVMGFAQAGVFELSVGSRILLQVPKPFLYAPSGDGMFRLNSAGVQSLTLTTGTPNTLNALVSGPPWLTTITRRENLYRVDPNILIEAEQAFTASLNYPAGLVPIIATTPVTTGNPLKVGCVFDGIVFRPVQ